MLGLVLGYLSFIANLMKHGYLSILSEISWEILVIA